MSTSPGPGSGSGTSSTVSFQKSASTKARLTATVMPHEARYRMPARWLDWRSTAVKPPCCNSGQGGGCPLREIVAADCRRHQVGEQLRGAGERGDAQGGEGCGV